jgi:redox-sensitive bicupin YhaK (pirin superfamily)
LKLAGEVVEGLAGSFGPRKRLGIVVRLVSSANERSTRSSRRPFVHMDQMGEVDYAPGEPKGTPWHPHRGFETVTYMIDGSFRHQDSNGGGGLITDGDTQWMTAGAELSIC